MLPDKSESDLSRLDAATRAVGLSEDEVLDRLAQRREPDRRIVLRCRLGLHRWRMFGAEYGPKPAWAVGTVYCTRCGITWKEGR